MGGCHWVGGEKRVSQVLTYMSTLPLGHLPLGQPSAHVLLTLPLGDLPLGQPSAHVRTSAQCSSTAQCSCTDAREGGPLFRARRNSTSYRNFASLTRKMARAGRDASETRVPTLHTGPRAPGAGRVSDYPSPSPRAATAHAQTRRRWSTHPHSDTAAAAEPGTRLGPAVCGQAGTLGQLWRRRVGTARQPWKGAATL